MLEMYRDGGDVVVFLEAQREFGFGTSLFLNGYMGSRVALVLALRKRICLSQHCLEMRTCFQAVLF
ncbi:MAG: hypothetical protein RBR38_07360 [Desulfomicrobium apsheronum]|nr:hypothetical protein [Desulfomicrobium apsheronum]